MHGFRRLLYVIALFIVSNKMVTNNVLLSTIEGQTINECTEGNHVFIWRKISGFIEEISETPNEVHLSEPDRISFTSQLPFKQLQKFEGNWIDIHFLINDSTCFNINDDKTKKMREKSDRLQRRLKNIERES